jgi:hypothetical protein
MWSQNKKLSATVAAVLALAPAAFAEVKVGAPCKALFPAYSTLQKESGQRGSMIVAVSADKKPSEDAAFLKNIIKLLEESS